MGTNRRKIKFLLSNPERSIVTSKIRGYIKVGELYWIDNFTQVRVIGIKKSEDADYRIIASCDLIQTTLSLHTQDLDEWVSHHSPDKDKKIKIC